LQDVAQYARTAYENAERIIKPVALGVMQRSQVELEQIKSSRYGNINQRNYGAYGGSDLNKEYTNTEGYETKDFINRIDYIKDVLTDDILKTIVRELDVIYLRLNNPVVAAAVSEPSLISMLYNNYQDRRNKVGQFVAAQELSKSLKNNALIPRDVLAVTTMDKTVFVFVTLVIRLFALSLTERIIERDLGVNKMSQALGVFLALYTLMFAAFVLVVNFDIYRMRIVFNYVNFHANASLVYTHIGALFMFSVIIYVIMLNVNFPIKGIERVASSDEEKSNLMYRLEILTMIIWLFLVGLIAVF
jgi:hypothetical protein